jgi:hypothetical protein
MRTHQRPQEIGLQLRPHAEAELAQGEVMACPFFFILRQTPQELCLGIKPKGSASHQL